MNVNDIIGKKFNRLTVIEFIERRGSDNRPYYLCRCDCGTDTEVRRNHITRGKPKSCGCYQREKSTTHGMSLTPELNTWKTMKARCYNKNNHKYKNYGGRGIGICKRWRDSFENFYEDIGDIPEGMSIDRTDNDWHYEPLNWRFATPEQQANNKSNNKLYTYKDEIMTRPQFARKYYINERTLASRLIRFKGDITRSIETPVGE